MNVDLWVHPRPPYARMSDDTPNLRFAGTTNSLFTPQEVEGLMRVEFERAMRYQYAVSCTVVQVDRLESLHSLHGVESKQAILDRVVELVREKTRDEDLMGFLAEDRLVCVFPHTSALAGRKLCERVLADWPRLAFDIGGEATIRISLSIGLAHNENQNSLGFDSLKRVAYEGAAVAEAAGGDRWAETDLYGLYEARRQRAEEAARAAAGERGVAPQDVRGTLEQMVSEGGDLEKAVSTLVEELMERALKEAKADLAVEQVAIPGSKNRSGEQEQAYQREIELLRRRVNKLTESLGLTEQELLRLRSAGTVDDGVASIYREVQGLSMEDTRDELKQQLMSSIFEANLDLHRKQRSA